LIFKREAAETRVPTKYLTPMAGAPKWLRPTLTGCNNAQLLTGCSIFITIHN